jgi:transposase
MLKLPSLRDMEPNTGLRIFLYTRATDMRQGFDRLAHLAREVCHQDPFDGHLFLFRSRRGDRLKILYWDRDGLALWYKRLEEGTFRLPSPSDDSVHLELKPWELALLLEGIDLRSIRRTRRYTRTKTLELST